MGKGKIQQYPLTARDAQRVWRKLNTWPPEDRQLREVICAALGLGNPHTWNGPNASEVASALARYAQVNGPKSVLLASPESESAASETSEREYQIGTDAVAEQSENPSADSEMHGGDSASGEVESGTSEGGDNESGAASDSTAQTQTGAGTGGGQMGQGAGEPARGDALPQGISGDDTGTMPDRSAGETGQATSPGTDTNRADSGNGLDANAQAGEDSSTNESAPLGPKTTGRDDRLGGEPVNKSGRGSCAAQSLNVDEQNSRDPDALRESLTGRANSGKIEDGSPDAPGKETGVPHELAGTEKISYSYRSTKRGHGQQGSTRAKTEFGGVTAELRAAKIDHRIARQARKALARLVDGGESQAGPRWDWVEFSKRLQTARSVYPARKEEEGRPAILVLADVSGSCSGFSDESVLVARAVATLGMNGADVIVVAHSNGYPQQVQQNGNAVTAVDFPWGTENEAVIAWYDEQMKRFDVQAVVALGDWDAEWLYRHFAENHRVRRFVWLDNWSANAMPPTVRRDIFRKAADNRGADWNTPWNFSQPWSPAAQRKTTYVVGCKDAGDFTRGMELAIRGGH